MKILAADYLLPISAPPIDRGAIAVDNSEIVATGTLAEIVALYHGAQVEDFGEAAILPGLVNCHSHLEITAMRGALDDVEHDFSSWLLRLNEKRKSLTYGDIRVAAFAGAREGAAAGVTCFGDIGRNGDAGFEALKSTGLRGVLFQETEFSVEDKSADDDFEKLIAKFDKLRAAETELVKVGISPHSPYTVGPKLFKLIADFAIANDIQLTIHAGESSEEHELLVNGTGFFTKVYEKYNVKWTSPGCSPIEYLDRLGVMRAKPLLAHCVAVSDSDISLIASSGSTIAHCPKSNAKFGHGYAPFESFIESEIAVGLGSDSVASNNVCDILEESRFASLSARNRLASKRFITAKEMLEVATLGGAKALRLDHLVGSLDIGKKADLAVVSLASAAQKPINDVHTALIFASNARDVRMTMVNGQEIFRSDRSPGE